MKTQRTFSLSNVAIYVVLLACLIIDFNLKNWEKQERVIDNDIHSYYAYLPATFIYNDIKLEKRDYSYGKQLWYFWPIITKDGNKVIKMTMGTAILYAPFFFVAHIYATLTNYDESGFSEPYKLFLLLSTVFYLYIGLGYLKKTLKYYSFSDSTIAITILLIGLGTNLLCYASQSAPMPHVYIFCLISIFIYYTIKWYQVSSIKNTIIIGFLLGLITLIRPSNAVILVFFALYGITSFDEFKKRLLFFKSDCFLLNLICFVAFLVWLPQLLYWKEVTGNYLVYSYFDEGFFFNHPRIVEGLLSFRKGWLIYTPIMAFALIGIFLLKGELIKIRLAIILFFIANIYIIFSWWCWWYGGSFGQRSMIDSYAIMSIPFASFIKYISEKRWYYKVLFYCLGLFFIWLNIFQTYQFENGTLHYDGMTKDLYFKQFGKLSYINDYDKYVSYPDYNEAKKGNSCEHKPFNQISIQLPKKKKELGRKSIQLKAFNNKYLSADQKLNNIIIANRDNGWAWETFTLIIMEKNECAICSSDGHFLSVEVNQHGEITATRTNVADWEIFQMINLDNDNIAFKGVNGKYLSIEENTFQVFARADSVGKREKFQLISK